ncbi:AAA family ATPase [Sphingobacterium tabacisoli]|uniref:AAA family ATPase n=1 Tax=Sphingobacterium tabacisoli TaxID=2044855 RepID=A0ABW5L8C8_9SPHI|nr:AAA family ATPase [Sphingobacterium tabacisoli]
MKIGNITELQETISYQNNRFSDQKYIICIRDERYEYNVIPLICNDNGKLIDLDHFEFENNLFASRPPYNNPHNIEDLPLNRFYYNQIIKISYGTIVENNGAENPNLPKVKTFNANIRNLETNQVIEIFDGKLNEADSLFTPYSSQIFELIKYIYVETENCFFTIANGKLIGPFLALKVNDNSFTIIKSSFRAFGEYELNEKTYLEFEANELSRKIYIPDTSNLALKFKKDFDFISDEELIKKFEIELQSHPDYFNESSLEAIKKVINKSSELKSLENVIKENHRLQDLLGKSKNILERNIQLINFIPDVKKIKDDKQKLEEDIFVLNRDFEKLKIDINKEIDELNHTKDTISNDISNLEQTKKEEWDRNKNNLDKEIEILTNRKNNLEQEVEQKQADLERHLEKTKKDIDYYERQKNELNQTIASLREDFKEEQKNAQTSLQNLVKSKIHFDFISGRDLSEQDDQQDAHVRPLVTVDKYNKEQYREFRNDLLNILRQYNRNFETHFIDNLLISIFQNTLTIFAGVPGTGKTTLARLLTRILTPKNRIREVSVNRGWTSQKDLIGFVNPLTKRFHSSSSDIYSLLKEINNESKEQSVYQSSPISFVILDEANLSPLEHYWSSFYNLTDSTGMLEIKLGHNEVINFPNNLRFIGTINYDHTTEELSPRVLDRVNIIQLDKSPEINVNNISTNEVENIRITFERCCDFFALLPQNNIDFAIDDKTEKIYKEIKTEFKNLKIFISPRVEIGIRRYVALASKYMSDVNKPLDYCIAQRLLPLINTQGAESKHKLENLKEKLKEHKCEISYRILDGIITTGSEKGIYEDNFNYFLTLSNV